MRRFGLVAALVLSGCRIPAYAVEITVNPVAIVKAIHDKTPVSTKWRRITGAIAFGGNALDWATTRKWAGPGGGACEKNPFLVTSPCVLNVPRLNRVKAAIAIGLVLEEWPHWRKSRHAAEWDKLGLIANVPIAVVTVAVGINNVRVGRNVTRGIAK